MENQGFITEKPRVRDCIRDGLWLYRKNFITIVIFIALNYLAGVFSSYALNVLRYSFIRAYELDINSETMLNLFELMESAASNLKLTLSQSIILLITEFVIQIVVGFVAVCGTVLVIAKSLHLLIHGNSSQKAIRETIRPIAAQSFKIWLILYIIYLLPNYILRFITLLTDLGNYDDFIYAFPILGYSAFALIIAVLIVVLIISATSIIICNLAFCHLIAGERDGVVRKAAGMARINIGTIFLIYLLISFIIGFVVIFLQGFGITGSVISSILIHAVLFIPITSVAALYHRIATQAPISPEEMYEQEEIYEPEQELEASGEVIDTLRFRVEPSLGYSDVGDFHCGLARVRQPGSYPNGKWGYADKDGKLVIPIIYKEASDFKDGFAVIKKGRGEYFINIVGKIAIDADYNQADTFSEGFAPVKVETSWGFITPDGETFMLPYDDLYSFSEGFAPAFYDGKWIYLDKALKPALTTDYDDIYAFSEGLAMVEKNGLLGFIDCEGREVIPPRYVDARSFSGGLAAVAAESDKCRLWGYIDKSGREIILPCFEDADSFSENRASVCVNGKYGHIDTKGTFITPPEYEAVGSFNNGFAVVKDELYGYVGFDGAERCPAQYLDARAFSEGLAWAKTEKGWGILEVNK